MDDQNRTMRLGEADMKTMLPLALLALAVPSAALAQQGDGTEVRLLHCYLFG